MAIRFRWTHFYWRMHKKIPPAPKNRGECDLRKIGYRIEELDRKNIRVCDAITLKVENINLVVVGVNTKVCARNGEWEHARKSDGLANKMRLDRVVDDINGVLAGENKSLKINVLFNDIVIHAVPLADINEVLSIIQSGE